MHSSRSPRIMLAILLAALAALCPGCTDTGNSGGPSHNDTFQRSLSHNRREYNRWLKNPSKPPKYRDLGTGAPMFY